MKILIKIVRKLIFSFGLLYSFNLIMGELGFILPLNLFSILFIALLGFPGLFALVGVLVII